MLGRVVIGVAITIIIVVVMLFCVALAFARDNGQYANSTLKPWFDQLASKRGNCCSFADGVRIEDVNWDVKDGHYRVWLDSQWIVVPDEAVITEPNRYGPAVVWPYMRYVGSPTEIRCFLPGSGA